jgi:hypothetical protein
MLGWLAFSRGRWTVVLIKSFPDWALQAQAHFRVKNHLA